MNRPGIAMLIMALAVPFTAFAGEKEDALIAKITDAYGGHALINLSNFTVRDEFLNVTFGQGHTPNLRDLGRSRQILTMDVKNKKAVYDTWFEGRGGANQNSTVSDGEKAYNVNYQAGTYGEADNADPYSFAGGSMRTSDVLLVHELNKVKDKAELLEDTRYMNRAHHVIKMPFPLSPDLNLYVDADTFLISKMVRQNPQLGNLDYVYSDYKKNNGVTYASSINFFIAGQPSAISTSHELSFNGDLPSNTFTLSEGLSQEGQTIDTTDMRVTKVSDRIYHVGQGNAYSLFADTNIGIVGVGGYTGLMDRFKHFQSETKSYKPLVYQVITHHHSDHVGGLGDAAELGARLVTVAENIDAVNAATSGELSGRDFVKVDARATFGEGRDRVEVYEVSTIHAASFLVTYLPSAKTVFIADHFGSPFADVTPVATQSSVDMLAALDKLDIDIKKIATAHNARIFKMADLRKSVAEFKPAVCSGDRPVCR